MLLIRVLLLIHAICIASYLCNELTVPEIVLVEQVDQTSVRLKWKVNSVEPFIKYDILVLKDSQTVQYNFPVQMETIEKDYDDIADLKNFNFVNAKSSFECQMRCIHEPTCSYARMDSRTLTSNCKLYTGDPTAIRLKKKNNAAVELFSLKDYSDDVVITNLKSNHRYSFRVRVMEKVGRMWTSYSDRSNETDMTPKIQAKIRRTSLDELTIEWSQINSNKFIYNMSKYRIEIRNENQIFNTVYAKNSIEKYQFQPNYDETDTSNPVFVGNLEKCIQTCLENFTCIRAVYYPTNTQILDDKIVKERSCFLRTKLDIRYGISISQNVNAYSLRNLQQNISLKYLESKHNYKFIVYGITPFGDEIKSNEILYYFNKNYSAVIVSEGHNPREGSTLNLTCMVTSKIQTNPFNTRVEWYKDGALLSKQWQGILLNGSQLRFLNLSKDLHNGYYSCASTIENERLESDPYPVRVHFGPTFLNQESISLKRNEGSSVQLNCSIGVYPLNVSYLNWYYVSNGQSIMIKKNVDYITLEDSFIKQSYLSLKNLTRKDSGIYICRSENNNSSNVNEIKVGLNVRTRPYGIKVIHFRNLVKDFYIEWSIEGDGNLDLTCIEIILDKSLVALENETKIEIIEKCPSRFKNEYMTVEHPIKAGYSVKIRFNNSIGYSEYSNQLYYPPSYKEDLENEAAEKKRMTIIIIVTATLAGVITLAVVISLISYKLYRRYKILQTFSQNAKKPVDEFEEVADGNAGGETNEYAVGGTNDGNNAYLAPLTYNKDNEPELPYLNPAYFDYATPINFD